MKTKILLFMALLLMVGGAFSSCSKGDDAERDIPAYVWPDGKRFYYSSGDKIYLDETPDEFALQVEERYIPEIKDYMEKNGQVLNTLSWGTPNIFILETTENSNLKTVRGELSRLNGMMWINPLCLSGGSARMLVTNEIIVKFKGSASKSAIDRMNKTYQASIIPTDFLESTLLSVPAYLDALEVANAYWESGLVESATPNFLYKIR